MKPVAEAFLESHPHWRDVTRACYRHWLQIYQTYLQERRLGWNRVTSQDADAFHQLQIWTANGRGGLQSANTVYQGMRLLRAFYRWACENKYTRNNPMEAWVLPRPPERSQVLLNWTQILQLFNLPDLSRPAGQRDHLMLHLLYQGLSPKLCRQLFASRRGELPQDPDLLASLELYLEQGRPQLDRGRSQALLLREDGLGFATSEGLCQRVRRYQRALGLAELNGRILVKSRIALEEQLANRRVSQK